MTHLLFGKTHLHAYGVSLESANLGTVAAEVGRALGLPGDKVWTVYVGEDQVDFDVMADTVELDDWQGAESQVLEALRRVDGVRLANDARIAGEGILGSVGWEGDGAAAGDADIAVAKRIQEMRRTRASVWSTGGELLAGRIDDQNAPYLESVARAASLNVTVEGVLADASAAVVRGVEYSLGQGAGWILTSGGIGKGPGDFTHAALGYLDPSYAHVPAVTFEHNGIPCAVEVGVGICEGSYVVALPGPHDEVRACGAVLTDMFNGVYVNKWRMAAALADAVGALFVARHRGADGQPG